MKPILFNTEMVRALLKGRKTVTRRVVQFELGQNPKWTGYIPDGPVLYGSNNVPAAKAPYRPGDILYVQETWCKADNDAAMYDGMYLYRADGSIHMPKEAARLFLRATDVWVERLQDITPEQARQEGCDGRCDCPSIERFESVWDSTIKPADRDRYGWNANPWVWVIEFERISEEAALQAQKGK